MLLNARIRVPSSIPCDARATTPPRRSTSSSGKTSTLIVADMPGTTEENIDIEYENGQLTLHGKVEERSCQEGACRLMQYESYDFYRVFRVGEGVDQSGISADYELGVLTVHLPKAPEAKPRKISVRPK